MEGATQSVLGLSAMGNEGPHLSYLWRGNPDGWNETSGQESGQVQGVTRIDLHASCGNDFHEQWMGNRDKGDERAELITKVPGVRRCFQDDGICWAQMMPGSRKGNHPDQPGEAKG